MKNHSARGQYDDAITAGNSFEVELLIEQGASPEDIDEALIWLIGEFKDIAVFNLMVDEPDIDLKRPRKHTPVGAEHSVRTYAERLLAFVQGERSPRVGESPELIEYMQKKYEEALHELESEEQVLDAIERIQVSLNLD